jgi:hypothetical protein
MQAKKFQDIQSVFDALPPPSAIASTVRSFYGGKSSFQYQWFFAAAREFPHINFEYLGVHDIPLLAWTPKDLIDWLLGGAFHVILTHPHQGNPQWDVADVLEEIKRLQYHRGFPFGGQLFCPVFLQDKYNYLFRLPGISNPTLKVEFPTSSSPDINADEIKEFCKLNDQGNGWYLKLPFTTNGEGRRPCRSIEKLLDAVRTTIINFEGRIPYFMVQPRLRNRMEYKVIVLNGSPKYICPKFQCPGNTRAFSKVPHTRQDILDFAKLAVMHLHRACPAAITSFMLRVDIMESNDGRFIVNEFESLEAMFESTPSNQLLVQTFLQSFWKSVISII